MRIKATAAALTMALAIAMPAWAAFEELEVGVPLQAMGGTGVVGTGLSSVLYNPAGLAWQEVPSVAAGSRLPFTNADFATHGLDGAMPLYGMTCAASLRYFGSDLYSEQVLALTTATLLTDEMAFGLQPTLARNDIADGVSSYGSGTAISWNMGFQVRVYPRWMLAASVRNPFQARLGESGDYLHRRLDGGVRYEPADGLASRFVVSQDFRGTRLMVGQSLPLGPVVLRAGAVSDPASLTAGLTVDLAGMQVDYGVQSHPRLDPSHQAGVRYAF
jgi:hypothetical protein